MLKTETIYFILTKDCASFFLWPESVDFFLLLGVALPLLLPPLLLSLPLLRFVSFKFFFSILEFRIILIISTILLKSAICRHHLWCALLKVFLLSVCLSISFCLSHHYGAMIDTDSIGCQLKLASFISCLIHLYVFCSKTTERRKKKHRKDLFR